RTAAEPPQPPAPEPLGDPVLRKKFQEERDAVAALRGTWELESRTKDGQPPEEAGAKWVLTFADRRVTVEQLAKDRHRAHTHRDWFTVNPRATPAELTIYGNDSLMLCRYMLDGDKLTL